MNNNWLILFYMNGCNYCEKILNSANNTTPSIWTKVINGAKDLKVNIKKYEKNEQSDVAKLFNNNISNKMLEQVNGYPTILLLVGNKIYNFDETSQHRTSDNILEFVKKYIPIILKKKYTKKKGGKKHYKTHHKKHYKKQHKKVHNNTKRINLCSIKE